MKTTNEPYNLKLPWLDWVVSYTLMKKTLCTYLCKSCHIVFMRSSKKLVNEFTQNNQSLKQEKDRNYLGVVLTDNLSCKLDTERVKLSFFKQFYSLFCKFNYMNLNVLLHLFKTHAMCFYGIR